MLTEFLVRFINIIAPKQCVMCGCRLAIGEDVICSSCNLDLPRTNFWIKPYDNEMVKSFWGQIPIDKAAALFHYRPHSDSSRIIYSMKYNDHPEIGELMGRFAAKEFLRYGFFDEIDSIVPIPLARNRKFSRGYNQSMEIARGVSGITHLPIIRNAVKRKSFTASQTHMNRWQRNENVRDVFICTGKRKLDNQHVLIIDDVVTSGATIIACAKELMKCGASKFCVMSLGFTKT